MLHASTRFGAVLAATSLSLLAVAGPALAAPGDPTTPPAGAETPLPAATPAPAGQIDPAATATLNIHKYLGDPDPAPATPAPGTLPAPTSGQSPLAGIQFRVQRITNVDLTTQAGWEALAALTPATVAPQNLTDVATITTDGAGLATISPGVGVYLVTEVQQGGYTVAPPFLVTLPFSNADGTWNYVRDVYPKNQDVTPNKQVDDSQGSLGGTLAYTINAPVPAGALTNFAINDPLNASLALDPASVRVTAPGVALDAADYTITTTNNTVNVTFTATGLEKLQAARASNASLQASVTFTARVISVPATGTIPNTATVTLPNGGTINTDALVGGVITPTSTTYGNLTITKTGGPTAEMAGAEFQVYACQQETGGAWTLLGSPLTVATAADGSTTAAVLATGADAAARAYGLPATSFSGGSTGTVANQYCVLETKAPAGYVRNPQPVNVTYTPVDGGVGTFTVTVNNVKDSILGQLPATGAAGVGLVFLLGGGLVAWGVASSRRDDKDQD